uniref:Uncharacterized protein n=1 Tax=Arundo donax TaxID=35708 RepID=A0A0A9AYJ1_ARUDO
MGCDIILLSLSRFRWKTSLQPTVLLYDNMLLSSLTNWEDLLATELVESL